MDLCEYFNSIELGQTNVSDNELMEEFPCYNNRKQIQRDLNRLVDMNYIELDSTTYTPVSINNGTAKQFVRKARIIRFRPSKEGLLALPTKVKKGDILGVSNETIHYKEGSYEDYIKSPEPEWIPEGYRPGEPLIKNPKYKGE